MTVYSAPPMTDAEYAKFFAHPDREPELLVCDDEDPEALRLQLNHVYAAAVAASN